MLGHIHPHHSSTTYKPKAPRPLQRPLPPTIARVLTQQGHDEKSENEKMFASSSIFVAGP